jgi:hypothetical protein
MRGRRRGPAWCEVVQNWVCHWKYAIKIECQDIDLVSVARPSTHFQQVRLHTRQSDLSTVFFPLCFFYFEFQLAKILG